MRAAQEIKLIFVSNQSILIYH